MNKGILVVVSGFSGAGKGTVMKRLMEKYDGYALSVSATTRKPRPGEEDGREYFFRTRDEFEKLIEEDALLEYAQYVENYYGTPRSYVEEQLQAGRNVILEIEIQGAMKIKEKIPEALLVFVTPPTVEELERRLTGRGTETAQVIADRLARAGEEAEGMGQYDYILVNDTVEECVDHLHQIIVSEHSRVSRNAEFIADIQKQTKAFQERRKYMIHPSYTELIEAINTNSEDDDTTMSLNSRYSLVLAASKRARQIIAGSKPMVEGAAGKKPLSVAIDELYKGKVKILAPEEEDEEGTEQTAEAQAEESAQASEITETAETAEETTAETTAETTEE